MKIGQLLSVKAIGIIGALSALTLGTALFMFTLSPPTHADDTPTDSEHLTLAESAGKVFCILDVGVDLATPYTAGYDCDKDGSADDMRFLITDTLAPDGNHPLVVAMDRWKYSAWTSIPDSNTDPDTIIAENNNFFAALPADLSTTISKTTAFPQQTWAYDSLTNNDIAETVTGITSTGSAAPISYTEWMGSTKLYNTAPLQGSIGDLFCKAFTDNGTSCYATSDFYNEYGTVWTRTPNRGSIEHVWSIYGRGSSSMFADVTENSHTVLPVMAASTSLELCDTTTGTFADPYFIAPDCPTPPVVTITDPTETNPWTTSCPYISGTITDLASSVFSTYQYISTSTELPSDAQWTLVSDNADSLNFSACTTDEGQHYAHYKVVNSLGIATYGYVPFLSDHYSPEISVTPSTDPIYDSPPTPTVTVTDSTSGIKVICYTWDKYIESCADPTVTIIDSGDTISPSPKDIGSETILHVYTEDNVGRHTYDRFTYKLAVYPPSITSITPTSGPTTGGTEITITGEHFSKNLLASDEFVIKSAYREMTIGNITGHLYQLTNKNRILISDNLGGVTILDTSGVIGNIIDLSYPTTISTDSLAHFYTDQGYIYFISDAVNEGEFSLIEATNVTDKIIDIAYQNNDVWFNSGLGKMIVLTDKNYAIFDIGDGDNNDYIATPDTTREYSPSCTPVSLVREFALCSDRTGFENTITGVPLAMPASITIANVNTANPRANINTTAVIIGSDSHVYILRANSLSASITTVDDFIQAPADYSPIKGTITGADALYDYYVVLLDDANNVYLAGGGEVQGFHDITDLLSGYADLKDSIKDVYFHFGGLTVATTTGDYYFIGSLLSWDNNILLASETKPSSISLGGSDCAVTSWTSTSITCTTSAHAPSLVDLTLHNHIGSATKSAAYTYLGDDPILNSTLRDAPSGISVEHLGSGFSADLYLKVTTVDPSTRNLGTYASFQNLGIYNIEICSDIDQSCVPIHSWSEGLKIKIPLSDTSYDRYHVLYLPNPNLANLISSAVEDGHIVFDSTHLSEYAIVASGSPADPPTVPSTGAEFLGIPLTPATAGGFIISLVAGAGTALWFTRRKWGKK